MSKVVGKLLIKECLWNLIYLISYLEEIKNATWLSNTYIPSTKESFPLLPIKAQYVILQFFLWLKITIIVLVLQLIWYYSLFELVTCVI